MKLRLLLPLLLLCSCSKNEDDDGVTLKDTGVNNPDSGVTDTGVNLGFNAQEVAADIATANCQYLTRCVPEFFDANALTEAMCISDTTDQLVTNYNDYGPLIEAGRVAYNESQKDACVQALATVDCNLGLQDGSPCDRVLVGTQPANAPCFFADECQPNLYCNRAQGLGTCGACAQAPAKTANCDPFTPCVENARCLDISQTQTPDYRCIPIDAPLGGACLSLDTGFCQGALSCVGDQTSGLSCVAPGGSGAVCDNDAQTLTNPDCNLGAGFACDGAMCTAANWSDLNGTCDDTTTFCREGFCSTGSCMPLPGAGASCMDSGACNEDAYCDGTNCVPLIAQSQPCDFSYQCTGENVCLGAGVNRQGTCGAIDWQLCE